MLNYIEHEVDSKIDHNIVLSKFIDGLFKKSSEYNINVGYCPKKVYLNLYVNAKIGLIKRIQADNISHDELEVRRNFISASRRVYYTTDCQCGSCNKKHDLIRYYNTKLEVR